MYLPQSGVYQAVHPAGGSQVYDGVRTDTPPEVLAELRDLFSRDPLLLDAGPEELAARTGAPVWAVDLAREALELEGGELAA